MKNSIFDIDIIPKKSRHPEMARLKAFLKKEIGGPCSYYYPGCIVCRAWVAFLTLDELFEEVHFKEPEGGHKRAK